MLFPAVGVWESEQSPPWEAEGGYDRELVFMGTRSSEYPGWGKNWLSVGVGCAGSLPEGGNG